MPELRTHDTQILESESRDAGVGIRIKIFGSQWNQNQNRLLLESALVESKMESESLVLKSFTTLQYYSSSSRLPQNKRC